MEDPFQLVMLPGIGADERLLEPQRRAFPHLIVPPWIPPRRGETMEQYAERLAETVSVTRPLVLGGVSLGGMLACEMARRLRPAAVVLVASCRSGQQVRGIFRRLRPLVPLIPARSIRLARRLSPLTLRAFSGAAPKFGRLLDAMFQATDPCFMKWGFGAILHWRPGPLDGVRVFQIHGEKDGLIPAARIQADEIVPGGGHFINLTHADRVNAFIRRAWEKESALPGFG